MSAEAQIKSPAIPEDVLKAAHETMQAINAAQGPNGQLEAIARAILAERQRIVSALKEEADLTPCSEDAMVTRSNARLIEADFSYEEAERLSEKEEA